MSFLCEFDRAHSRFTLMLEQSLKRWDITCSQFRLLDTLDDGEKLRPKDIADKLEIDVAASTRLIDRLEQKKMVKKIRCEDDRRVCYISIPVDFKHDFKLIKEHQSRVEQVFLDDLKGEYKEVFQIAIKQLAKLKKYRSGETGLSVVF
jgi:MarR family 2-MHQ and catechol resistance regulon transcriptional repressor